MLMSNLMASYTTAMSRLPVLPASSRGSCRPSVAFKPSYVINSPRGLTVTFALPEKERPTAFSIPPTALLCPVSPPDGKERWDIKDEDDHVTLWLQVPGVSTKDIEVTTGDNVLEIKRKAIANLKNGQEAIDVHGVGKFHIRLLMTGQFDANRVQADLKEGMLEVTVYKDQQRKRNSIMLGAPAPGNDKPNKNNNQQPTKAGSGLTN